MMQFRVCSGVLKDFTDAESAKVLHNFLMFQYHEAVLEHIRRESVSNGMVAANEAAARENRDDCGGWTTLPYSEEQIKFAKSEVVIAEQSKKEFKTLLDFYVSRLCDKFVSVETK